jgi:hypothetical protein
MALHGIHSSSSLAASSAKTSVSEGISELKRSDGLKQAIHLFDRGQDSFVEAAQIGSKSVAGEAAIQPPVRYYERVSKNQPGLVDANELKRKLDDPNLDISRNLDRLIKSLTDMSEMDKFDLQKIYQDYQLGISTLSNIIKSSSDDQQKLLPNIKA